MRELAGRQQSAVVYFSQVDESTVLAWVVRSTSGGGEATNVTCVQLDLPSDDAASFALLVELTRQAAGARARDAPARSARSLRQAHLRNGSLAQADVAAAAGDDGAEVATGASRSLAGLLKAAVLKDRLVNMGFTV